MKVIKTNNDFEHILKLSFHGPVLLMLHSTASPLSLNAKEHYQEFAGQHPETPCYILEIQHSKNLSGHIEQTTGIAHVSPQCIFLRDGEAKGHLDNNAITETSLKEHMKKIQDSQEQVQETQA